MKKPVQGAMHCQCGNAKIIAHGLCWTCYSLKRQDEAYFGGLREKVLERDGYRCRVCAELPELDRLCIGHPPSVHHRVEAHDHAIVGLDGHGQVCFSNSLALNLFAAGDGLRLSKGRLYCSRPEENLALQRMLGMNEDIPGSALLISRNKRSSLHLTVLPVKKTLPGRSSPLSRLLFITDPSLACSRATIARRLYGVTPSEGRVADLLLQGLDIREISEKLKITLETTRFQVKRILKKTGTRRQSELLRLLTALPGSSAF